jgi:hypothetical protein
VQAKSSQGHWRNSIGPGTQVARFTSARWLASVVQADHHGRGEVALVARVGCHLESNSVDDESAVLIQPLRGPQEHTGIVTADDPELAIDLVELHELDAVEDACFHRSSLSRFAAITSLANEIRSTSG